MVSRWASHFNMVKTLLLVKNSILSSLACHVWFVPHAELGWSEKRGLFPFSTLTQSFCNLKRLCVLSDLSVKQEASCLACFASHLPRLERFKFLNLSSTTADIPSTCSLIDILPSLSQLTHLRFSSNAMLPLVDDGVLIAIAKHCTLITNLRLEPQTVGSDVPLTDAGVIALASGCAHLTTFYYWGFPSSLLNALLTHSSSLTHLHLPNSHRLSVSQADRVNAMLAKHPHITRLSIHTPAFDGHVYSSPHTRVMSLLGGESPVLDTYLKRNRAVTDFTVRTCGRYAFSCEVFADIKRRFPKIKRLVWERMGWMTSVKSEERFIAGQGDPRSYRVVF